MADDKIYYYTSNFVLENWMKNQKIWATRSVTSNDASDTVYAIDLFSEIKQFLDRDYEINLKDAKAILQLNKYISKKFYKDLLYYMMLNHYEEFRNIIQNEKIERKNGSILEINMSCLSLKIDMSIAVLFIYPI